MDIVGVKVANILIKIHFFVGTVIEDVLSVLGLIKRIVFNAERIYNLKKKEGPQMLILIISLKVHVNV